MGFNSGFKGLSNYRRGTIPARVVLQHRNKPIFSHQYLPVLHWPSGLWNQWRQFLSILQRRRW